MKKHLILVLALALVAGLTVGAYAEVQNVKVSGDINVLALSRQLSLTSQKAENTLASIVRVRVDADLTDNVIATVRLINERYWGNDNQQVSTNNGTLSDGNNNSNIDIDLAYVTLKEFLYSPLTLTVGRQELHFGNDMIIGDAYTNNQTSKESAFYGTIDKDLGIRKSFDAIRATLNYDPLVVDVVAAQVKKNYRTVPYGTSTAYDIDDQETLVGINANYAVSKTTNVEAYFWQKRVGNNAKLVGDLSTKAGTTNVVGVHLVTKPVDNLTFQIEPAYQFGKGYASDSATNQLNREAWAVETIATYDLKDVKAISKYKPTVSALYAYFSGDRGKNSGTKTYGGWDPMYENQTFGAVANTLVDQTNMHVVGGILTAKPVDDVTLKGEYYAYWWDKRFADGQMGQIVSTGEYVKMTNNKFIGQEIDLSATYDYTEDVQFGLLGGVFITGNSFASTNKNTAGEVIGSMKVTF